MALANADRVKETSTTTGTGTYTLAGAVTGFRTFSIAVGNGNTCYYVAEDGASWEVGVGTVGAGTLARTTVLASSNANSAVNWTSGTRTIYCAPIAARITEAGWALLDDADASAMRTTLGLGTAATSASSAFAAASHTHTASEVTDFAEAVDDRVGALLVAGTNVTLTYNDAANTLTIAASGGGGTFSVDDWMALNTML